MTGSFKSWNAPLITISQTEKEEEAGSAGGSWILNFQASDKVRGWKVERKRMFSLYPVLVRDSQ